MVLTSFNCRLLKSNCLDSSTSLPWTIEKYNKQTRQTRQSTTLILFFFLKGKKKYLQIAFMQVKKNYYLNLMQLTLSNTFTYMVTYSNLVGSTS